MTIITPKGFSATGSRTAECLDTRISHRAFTRQNHQTRTNREVPVIPTNGRIDELDERNRIMRITRGLAAGAMFAGLALVLTAPVSSADLNGHYIETETYPDGHQDPPSDWYISPCGDGCAQIQHLGQAHLNGNQWTLDGRGGVTCEDGGDVHDAISYHYAWDANTMDGSVQITNNVAACGNPQGYQENNKLHLAPAP
jgi:hypothetical protein